MNSIKKQSGAVLIVGLVMVLILSVVVIASSKNTLLQQKMSSNMRDKELAFQAAETALKAGEGFLEANSETTLDNIVFDDTAGYYVFDSRRDLKEEDDWKNLSPIETQSLFQVIKNPVYIIEQLPNIKAAGDDVEAGKAVTSRYYRVTAMSKGGTDASVSVLQTMYKK